MTDSNNPPKKHKDYSPSRFDIIPPLLLPNATAKDYVDILKEARWNNDYKNEVIKNYLGAASINDVVFADYKCSLAKALVLRYILQIFLPVKA